MQKCDKHNYIVVSWDGDEARKLMCAHCLQLIKYKDAKCLNLKDVTFDGYAEEIIEE